MSQDNGKPNMNSKGPRWVRILLVMSLALNLAVIGMLAGTAYRVKDRWAGKPPPPPSLSVTLYRALDRETRHTLMQSAAGDHPNIRALREADRKALFATLQADPFEVEAVARVLEGQAQRQYQFREKLRQSWLDQVAGMSEEERAKLLERLRRDPRGHFKGKDRQKGSN
ncbi:periplasmic heavy metal sensor [Epibacterium ulvae]|uniref:periplasmic heavy metal sensor n=1 Tax=Epibacterium ulvae TaxID=1156985 RepID=UPI001BFC195B|nr:periplasmic heavy metal sensor [Epibacterium ulvae]MBT8155970.1 periplasmic heavy metal sensor [Epibacterium ulvae]